MKKLIRAIQLRLAYWHRKRFNILLAKALGGKKYYLRYKNQSSLYGMTVTEMSNIYKVFHSGKTNADMSSLYPNVMRTGNFSYKDTDSAKG